MSLDKVKLNETIYFDWIARHPLSGTVNDADTTPKFWVFKDAAITGVSAANSAVNMSLRTGFQGHYYGSFTVDTGQGFVTGSYYNVLVSGRVGNILVLENPHTFYVENNSFDSLGLGASGVYFADINLDRDDVSNRDEYTAIWFKDGVPNSGFTSPTLRVFKRDGTDLIAETSMSGIGDVTIGAKYDTTGALQRLLEGDAAIILAKATIDGATREWTRVVSRDVNVNT